MLKFRSVSLKKKMLTYPLKWIAAVFLKEIVVIYHSSLRLKNQQLDQVGPTLKSIYHFRYYSNPSPRHAYLQGFLAVNFKKKLSFVKGFNRDLWLLSKKSHRTSSSGSFVYSLAGQVQLS